MAFTLEKGLEPVVLPDPVTVPGLLVGVGDSVADAPMIPCEDADAEFMPAAASEAVGVARNPAASVGGRVLDGRGVEVAPPGRTVSVGKFISANVGEGVQVGTPGMPVAVGVRPNGEQSGILDGVAFGLSVSVGAGVLVDAMGVVVGMTGVSVEIGGSVGTIGGSVGTIGGSVGLGGLSVFAGGLWVFGVLLP